MLNKKRRCTSISKSKMEKILSVKMRLRVKQTLVGIVLMLALKPSIVTVADGVVSHVSDGAAPAAHADAAC